VYLTTPTWPRRPGPDRAGTGRARRTVISSNVIALGAVSLVTDVSAEMVTAVLPIYLVLGMQLGPAAYGAVDGLYTGATAILRLVGGYVADRTDRRKVVAGLGYGLSAVAKLGLLAVERSAVGIGLVVAVDRAGKGLRTAPRDALITLSSPPDDLARAFGVHRTMDAFGAFLGPLLALAVLAGSAQSFDAVFVTSSCIAVFGVLLLVLFVQERRRPLTTAPPVRLQDVGALIRDPAVRRLIVAAGLLGVVTIGEGFVYLLLQRREDLGITWFPLLAVGTNVAFLMLAAPLGQVADRIGRAKVLLFIGYPALMLVYLLLAGPFGGRPMLVLTLLLFGVFFAATDGVLMALAGPMLPAATRTTGIALIQTGQALAYLVSSVLFGLGWQYWGPDLACLLAAGAVALAMLISVRLLAVDRTPLGLDR
jgi:MFS family permease